MSNAGLPNQLAAKVVNVVGAAKSLQIRWCPRSREKMYTS